MHTYILIYKYVFIYLFMQYFVELLLITAQAYNIFQKVETHTYRIIWFWQIFCANQVL